MSSPATPDGAATATATVPAGAWPTVGERSDTDEALHDGWGVGNALRFVIGSVNVVHGNLILYRGLAPSTRRARTDSSIGLQTGVGSSEEQLVGGSGLGRTVAVVSLPPHMTVADFIKFVATHSASIRHIRTAQDPARCRYLILVTLKSRRSAHAFIQEFHGRHFSSLEPELCHVVRAQDVQLHSREACAATVSPAWGADIGAATSAYAPPAPPTPAAAAGVTGVCTSGNRARAASAGVATAPPPPVRSPRAPPLFVSVLPFFEARTPVEFSSPVGVLHETVQAAGAGAGAGVGAGVGEPGGLPPSELPAAAPLARGISDASTVSNEDTGVCPVCLDRLRARTGALVTTLCQHTFHAECLMRCELAQCPVCRHPLCAGEVSAVSCETCHLKDSLWMCLVCGHVGCGRDKSCHAQRHWQATSHTYAVEVATQRVWDYAGEGYVHRLVQNLGDGKPIEFSDPSIGSGHGDSTGGGGPLAETMVQRSQVPPVTDVMAARHLDLKVSTMRNEYNALLTAQLDTQRQYFEKQLSAAGDEACGTTEALTAEVTEWEAKVNAAQKHHAANEKARRQWAKRSAAAEAALKKLEQEEQFLRQLNATLKSDHKLWPEKLSSAIAARRAATEAANQRVQELTARLGEVMQQLASLSDGAGDTSGAPASSDSTVVRVHRSEREGTGDADDDDDC